MTVRILGIETSCDDTSAAVLHQGRILSNVVSSQDNVHADYGGVVPELAARCHLEVIQKVVGLAMERADTEYGSLDAIAVTRGPGLMGSLLVGVSTAEGLAARVGVPLIGVNHLEGHALSGLIETDMEFPFLALLVSGGHTALYLVRGIGDYVEVASTRDDAAGEAFDKGAKMLGLGYPGGRLIDDLSQRGKADAVAFPRARVRGDALALSFSGLKTSLWDYLNTHDGAVAVEDVCASFQEAIVAVLVDRARAASRLLDVPRVAVAGGVSANSRLRTCMQALATDEGIQVVFPLMSLCTDNAAMIAYAAWRRQQAGVAESVSGVAARLPLGPPLRAPQRLGRDG